MKKIRTKFKNSPDYRKTKYSKPQKAMYWIIAIVEICTFIAIEMVVIPVVYKVNLVNGTKAKYYARWFTFFTNWTMLLITFWAIVRIISTFTKLPDWMESRNFDTLVAGVAIITGICGSIGNIALWADGKQKQWEQIISNLVKHWITTFSTVATYLAFAKNSPKVKEDHFIVKHSWTIDIFWVCWLVLTLIIFYADAPIKFPYPFISPDKIKWYEETILCILIVLAMPAIEMIMNEFSNLIINRNERRTKHNI